MDGISPEQLERWREQSGLSLDRDGRFRHEGTLIEHPRVEAALRRGLGRSPDGRPTVTFGRTWAYLAVEDVLYRVVHARCEAEGPRLAACGLTLDDRREEPLGLGPGTVALDGEGVLYLRLERGEWARCLPQPHAALGAFVEERAGQRVLVTLHGHLPIEPR